jgi:hypothetical protein
MTTLVALLGTASLSAAKKPQPPTQPTIEEQCVTISEIRSHKRGWVTSPGIEGLVRSGCAEPVHVAMTISYYNRRGVQFFTGYQMGVVAPGDTWKFYHVPIMEEHQRALDSARIIRVSLARP